MPNGEAINEQLEFTERIRAMSSDDRSIYTAQKVYELTIKYEKLNNKFDSCFDNRSNKKTSIATGGIAGFAVAVIIGIIEYFTKR